VAVPVILLIGWLDYATGPRIGLSLLYLIPVSVVAWRGRGPDAIGVAIVAAACWIAADLLTARAVQFSLWNGLTRLVIYTATAFLVHRVRVDRDALDALNSRLQEALQRETTLARTDLLTGLPNSRAFLEQLPHELARAGREKRPVAVLYLDVDHFKSINDRYGHSTGDEVLRRIAEAITQSVRAGDLVARIGGDEFMAVLWSAGAGDATIVAERVSARVLQLAGEYPEAKLGISIGIADASQGNTADEIVRAADASMYDVKSWRRQTGR
jgi:diguanylate cyclase (GGDEF)-like protein